MHRSIWFVIVGSLVMVDHQAKQLATLYLYYGVPRPITSWLNATLLHNKGAAFSFLSSSGGWQIWFFSAVSLVVSVGITLWYWRLPSTARWLATALALVLGGALGNLWDRVTLGYVIDFIDVYYGTYHWPAFNIADSAICVGAAMLLWDTFRHPQGNTDV